MKPILIVLSLICSFATFAQTDMKDLDNLIKKVIKEKQPVNNTGLAISIFRANKVLFTKGYGYKNRKTKTPVDIKTLFAIGSTTKAFTAFGIAQLVDQGKINFDDPVVKHLPQFKVQKQSLTNKILIEDILSHRTGLPRHDFAWYATEFTRKENFNHIQYFDFNPNVGMGFRESFQYNNFMFLAAGTLIEEVSGISWENFIQNNILNPLNMNSTYLSTKTALRNSNIAVPYYLNSKLNYAKLTDIAPAGSIFSNVADMSKWLRLHLKRGVNNQGVSLINEANLNEMYTPRIPLNNDKPDINYSYGLGWMIDSKQPNRKLIFHGGNIDGFTALVLISHDLNLGIVTLVNQSGAKLNNDIVLAVLDHLSPSSVTKERVLKPNFLSKSLSLINSRSYSTPTNDINKIFDLDSIFTDSHFELSKYVGSYDHPGYGKIHIESTDGSLWAKYYLNYWKLNKITHDIYDHEATAHFSGFEMKIPFKFNLNYNDDIISLGIPFEDKLGYDIIFRRES